MNLAYGRNAQAEVSWTTWALAAQSTTFRPGPRAFRRRRKAGRDEPAAAAEKPDFDEDEAMPSSMVSHQRRRFKSSAARARGLRAGGVSLVPAAEGNKAQAPRFCGEHARHVLHKSKEDAVAQGRAAGQRILAVGFQRVVVTEERALTFDVYTADGSYQLTAESERDGRVGGRVPGDPEAGAVGVAGGHGGAMQGWLVKIRHGRSRRRWCVQLGRVLYYYKRPEDTIPLGQIYLLDARVDDVDPMDGSDREDDGDKPWHVFGPKTRHAEYFLVADTASEKDKWMFFIVAASNSNQLLLRTETERCVSALRDNGARSTTRCWRALCSRRSRSRSCSR